jgi:hypothetical protein
MPLGVESIVLRIMRLEKWLRKLRDMLDALADQLGRLQQRQDREDRNREGEVAIVRPAETIGPASFTEAVTGPPYQAARIVPDTGLARVWQPYDADTGELRALNTTRRWDPGEEEFVDEDARVTIDNINADESIPASAKYVICVRKGGRWVAVSWHCGD